MATLESVFKQKYAEALEPLGYVKLKGKYPYFVQFVGKEIIKVIACRKESGRIIGEKAFNILAGVATVYRQGIDLSVSPQANMDWLRFMYEYYSTAYPHKHGDDIGKSIHTFYYQANDDGSLLSAVNYSLDMTKQIILPIFDCVTDIDSCLLYMRKYVLGSNFTVYDETANFGNSEAISCNEGLLQVAANYHGDFTELIRTMEMFETIAQNRKKHDYPIPPGNGTYDEYYERELKIAKARRTRLDKILDDPEKLAKAQTELQARKLRNVEILRGYGLNL